MSEITKHALEDSLKVLLLRKPFLNTHKPQVSEN